jgi:hypothetical protein
MRPTVYSYQYMPYQSRAADAVALGSLGGSTLAGSTLAGPTLLPKPGAPEPIGVTQQAMGGCSCTGSCGCGGKSPMGDLLSDIADAVPGGHVTLIAGAAALAWILFRKRR